MTRYPLLFTYHDAVVGNGFIAGVILKGRALMEEEEDGSVWIYGVNPGGVGCGGQSQQEAAANFREEYRTVLFDIADDAPDFPAFKAEAEAFFHDTSEAFAKDWEAAVGRVRSGEVKSDWLERQSAESERSIVVVKLCCDNAGDSVRPESSFNVPHVSRLAA